MRLFSRLRTTKAKLPPRWRPRLEALEDRWAPATLQVTSALDDVTKSGTLRYAVAHAGNGDKIVLKADVLASGITLTQGELLLTQQDLTIDTKAGSVPMTISGDNLSRIFEVAPGADVTLNNLIVTGGNAQTGNLVDPHEGRGGGIVVDEGGALKITDCTVTNNSAVPIVGPATVPPSFAGGLGGGIADYGKLTVDDSAVTNNQALYTFGGGIAVFSGAPFSAPFSASLSIRDSTVSGNTANQNGGGIAGVASTITVDNCDVTNNTAGLYDGGGLNNHGGTLTISHSRITNNSANHFGGGVTNFSSTADVPSTLTIDDCDMSGNTGGFGGGVDNAGTLTLRDSRVCDNVTTFGFGGGVMNEQSGTATLRNDLLTGNAASDGGGVESFGSLVMSDCRLSLNTSRNSGGAIGGSGDMTINNCVLSHNSAYYAGAIVSRGTANIRDCVISDNTAAGGGGAIGAFFGTTTIRNSTLSGNTAGWGGAIYSELSILSVRDSTLSGNVANIIGGGALYSESATDTFTNCGLSDNTSTQSGGAVMSEGGTLALSASTVTGNVAAYRGGGIYSLYSTLKVSDGTTISGNTATSAGGGLFVGDGSTVTISNHSRVVDSTAPAGAGMDVYIQQVFFDPSSFYLEGNSQLGDVFNGGTLYKDAASRIGHLDGNPVIPL